MRSRRRQLVAIMETCIASVHRAGTLEVRAAWLEGIVTVLRGRWPEATAEIPLYPAFGYSQLHLFFNAGLGCHDSFRYFSDS